MIRVLFFLLSLAAFTVAESGDVHVNGRVGRMQNNDRGSTGYQEGDTYDQRTEISVGNVERLCNADRGSKCYQADDDSRYDNCRRNSNGGYTCWD